MLGDDNDAGFGGTDDEPDNVPDDIGTAKSWAKRFSELLTEDEFCRFVRFVDGCDDVEFWSELTEIDATRHPAEYTSFSDVPSETFDL